MFPCACGGTRIADRNVHSRAKTWIQAWGKMDIKEAWAAPGPERASPIRRSNPGLDSGPLGWPLFGGLTARLAPVLLFGANLALENRD